ncbi:MAG TPA: Rrf2 family transcriptional regulator [Noviherbaspirillum sp.]|uniref:RrF2 family transcriptional regulator n=1 Tax=Noviherbaspirillum sp. TaxID=1926288 RepID=UPI002B49C932|nr:Rrf2 family transcriptional regulator [Noviherbaspirillum sp.]HJV87444.1 Rrf2 family transcriptional regulator [Noviherbaspirillum sp.]
MHLTHFSDIGLRVLMYLAQTGERTVPVTVAEIATQFEIPANHLVKVVGHLARAGWILAIRGRNGGISLCADPAELKVGVVLRELEGDTELVGCEERGCALKRVCLLRDALRVGLCAFYATMDNYTLADITEGSTGKQIARMHTGFLKELSRAAGGSRTR